jgi:profilin
MSWQDYVDRQLIGTGRVTAAAICGLDGNVWARSGTFAISKEEVVALLNGMQDPSQLYTNGFYVAGTRYIYLSGSDVLVRGRKELDGAHCVKTNRAVIIATYEEPIKAEQTASVVESLGDYLKKCGY